MESEKQKSFLRVAEKISDSLLDAQYAIWTLNAIHHCSSASPEIDESRPLLMDLIWRGLFDRLYMKIGSVIERSDGAGNLHYLRSIVMAERDIDQVRRKAIDDVFLQLETFDELRQWRNKAIAHNDLSFDAEAFYEKHKMHVSNYQPIIDSLYVMLNTVSYAIAETIYMKPDESEYARILREAGDLYQ